MNTSSTIAITALALAFGSLPGMARTAAHAKLIGMKKAQATALEKEPGTIKSKELENEGGKKIYSFDIKAKDGLHEVNVDALTGEVVEDKLETPADEAREKQQDKSKAKAQHRSPKK